jgi:Tol biopolymer transport system component
MGEVYRARDTRLKRDVALKILAGAWIHDADRRARFRREAELLATLNHPNIAAIYGVEEAGGIEALLLELVEGATLADRLASGPLSVSDALAVARQIVDALDAAHERGIIHRDLKPANIKVRDDGTVKILDFGLAKALSPDHASAEAANSPTITSPAVTEAGVILGTAAYMSPEQARGRAMDKRTDIWAFGCVLYEMLSGRRAFPGPTVTDTLAAILERQPDWSALPASTPPAVLQLIRRCLEKDRKLRLRDIGDARAGLDQTATEPPAIDAAAGTNRRDLKRARWLSAIAGAAVVVALAVAAFAARDLIGLARPEATIARFVPLVVEPADEAHPAWSPDGRSIAYVAQVGNVWQIFTRTLDAAVSTQITSAARNCLRPFWSPDGARIYFISQDDLFSVGAVGGEPRLVMNGAAAAALSPDGRTLAFLRGPGGRRTLQMAAIDDLKPQPYRTPPFPETFGLSWSLEFSPDGLNLAVLVRRQEGDSYTSELWVLPYPTGAPRRVLDQIPEAADSRLSWMPDSRHIVWDSRFPDTVGSHLYVTDTADGTIRQLTASTVDEASPAVSPDGKSIAFATGSDDFDLISIALDGGDIRPLLASARTEMTPAWSPDGKQYAYVTDARGPREIWVRGLDQGWARPLVARDAARPAALFRPYFSPDGHRIVYEEAAGNHTIRIASVADGRGVPLDVNSTDQHSPAWSPDGNWIAYQRLIEKRWELVKVASSGGVPVRLGAAAAGGGHATAWSPSEQWLAHVRGGALLFTAADGSGTERKVDGPPPAVFGFSRDGSVLYAVRRAPNGAWALVTLDVQSGKTLKTTSLNLPPTAALAGFSLNPDGKSFATATGVPRHDIWLLTGFKPGS